MTFENENHDLRSDSLVNQYNDKSIFIETVDCPATGAKRQRSRRERSSYLSTLYVIDPKYAFKVSACGDYGISSSNPHGARCDCPVCPRCIPIRAAINATQLDKVVTTIRERLGGKVQFVTGSITMSSTHGTLMDRMTLLGDTLTRARRMTWFKKAVLGYEEILHYSGTGDIHGHIQVIYAMKPTADLETFKINLHAYEQKRIGSDLVNYQSNWMAWLAPATPDPALSHYLHSDMMKSGNGYTNFCDRKVSDLQQIIPCISSFDQVRRGGIVNQVRKELGMNRQPKEQASVAIEAALARHEVINQHIETMKRRTEEIERKARLEELDYQLEKAEQEYEAYLAAARRKEAKRQARRDAWELSEALKVMTAP